MISMQLRALEIFNCAQSSLFRRLIILHLLLLFPFLLRLFFILILIWLLILERHCEILYFVDLGDKLVKPVSFLGRIIVVGLRIILALTLRTFIRVALSSCRHYELFFLVQFRRSLIRRLSVQNLSITVCQIVSLDLWERFTDVTGDFSLVNTEHESIEDCRRQIVVVNLLTFMRRLGVIVVVLEEEEKSVRLRNPLVKEWRRFKGILSRFICNRYVRVCSDSPPTDVIWTAIDFVLGIVFNKPVSILSDH